MHALILFAATAAASGFGTQYDDDWAPQRFRKLGTTVVTFATQKDINRICGKAPDRMETEACTGNDDHIVVLPDPCIFNPNDAYARIVCHELAHRMGRWPSDHPR